VSTTTTQKSFDFLRKKKKKKRPCRRKGGGQTKAFLGVEKTKKTKEKKRGEACVMKKTRR
jgi:hypothetical protein